MIELVERDLAVARRICRSAESRDERLREVRRLDRVGFLRLLTLGARREVGMTLYDRRVVHQERLLARSSLGPDEVSGKAGIEHDDVHVGRHAAEVGLELAVLVGFVSEPERLFVGMPRIIEKKFRSPRASRVFPDRVGERVERVLDVVFRGIDEHDGISRGYAADFAHRRGEPLRVGSRVPETFESRPAVIGGDVDRVSLHGERVGLVAGGVQA